MNKSFEPALLPDAYANLNQLSFMDSLIDATVALKVYIAKIGDSRVDSQWVRLNLQRKEALASTLLEGTQATLDGFLISQVESNFDDKNLNEIHNYLSAAQKGEELLRRADIDSDFICALHNELFSGKVRKTGRIGEYRNTQNCVGRRSGEITYIPPKPEMVPGLMKNLLEYVNSNDELRPLVRIAIIHAQFETIHPFGDGNGRIGRMLIPLYLYWKHVLPEPYLFLSESLERDKLLYYRRLMDVRERNLWEDWIHFFLVKVKEQCERHIEVIDRINNLFQPILKKVCVLTSSSNGLKITDFLFQYPVFDSKLLQTKTGIPLPTLNRYLNVLVNDGMLFTDGKRRNRIFFFYDLLSLLRA